ncbi:MAG: NUDIX hydrolase [Alphaproteobacteria bacterium]|nr:NUDIX hydrolase [Alphaproteobacteria bacterium]
MSASDDQNDAAGGISKPRGPIVFTCPFLKIRQDPVTGAGYPTGDYYVLERPDSVSVVAVTLKKSTVLLRQERHPLGESTWEFPGGHVDDGETAEAAARRELREETGLAGGVLELLSWHYPIAGLAASRTTVFAAYLDEAALDDARVEPGMDEIAELRIVALTEIAEMIRTGRIRDAFTITAYTLFTACSRR